MSDNDDIKDEKEQDLFCGNWVPFCDDSNEEFEGPSWRVQRDVNRLSYGFTTMSVKQKNKNENEEQKKQNDNKYGNEFEMNLPYTYDDVSVGIIGHVLTLYHFENEDLLRHNILKNDKTFNKQQIMDLKLISTGKKSNKINKHDKYPWLTLWPQPKYYGPIYLDLCFASSTPDRRRLKLFTNNIEHWCNADTDLESTSSFATVSLMGGKTTGLGDNSNTSTIKAKTVTAIMDGIGKLCSKYELLSGIVTTHIAIDYKGQMWLNSFSFVLLCLFLVLIRPKCICFYVVFYVCTIHIFPGMKALCTGFKNCDTCVHPLHKVDKPIRIDRLSLFNAGLNNKSVIELFNILFSCIDKGLFNLKKLDLSNNELGIGTMHVLCDVLNIYSSSFAKQTRYSHKLHQ